MPREVTQTQTYSNILVKLIPTEIVGGYMMLANFLGFGPGTDTPQGVSGVLIQVVFFFFLALTPLYLWIVSEVRKPLQLGICTISYLVWVYSLGGPFEVWGWSKHPQVAAVVMVLWTFVPPFFFPTTKPKPAEPAE